MCAVRLLLQPKTSRSHIPISNVTKRGFLTSSNSADILTTPPGPDPSSRPGSVSSSHSLLPLRLRQQKVAEESATGLRNRSDSLTCDAQHQGSILAWPERRPRPLSQPVPYALHCPLEDDADSISLARSISKDSLASNIMSMTPKHMPGAPPPQHRLSVQSLLSHLRIEDEEEEVEEEELVAVIHPAALPRRRPGSDMEQDELEIPSAASNARRSPRLDGGPDGYYLEPLMPAVSKPAKEKSVSLSKREESGESRCKATAAARKGAAGAPRRAPESTFTPIPVAESARRSLRPPTEGSSGTAQPEKKPSSGFFLHSSAEVETPSSAALGMGQDSDSDIADLEDDDDEDEQTALTKEVLRRGKGAILEEEGEGREFGEGESAKLREDLKVSERDDKEGGSGRSSPCLSTASTSSSQKTTPDGSEVAPCSPWQVRSDAPLGWLGKEPGSALGKNLAASPPVVPSELLQLHMQLEEQRRAIEHQKKKMETLSARQRLKLGKAAFLNIVKKGGGKSETLPLPLKHSKPASEPTDRSRAKTRSSRDDSCLDALKVEAGAGHGEGGRSNGSDKPPPPPDNGAEPDLNECSHSIDLLNDAISSIQQQMMQLSFQQDQLMKRVAPPPQAPVKRVASPPPPVKQASFAVHFVDINAAPGRRPPKLSSGKRGKTSEPKKSREDAKTAAAKSQSPSLEGGDAPGRSQERGVAESAAPETSVQRNATFRVGGDPDGEGAESFSSPAAEHEENTSAASGREAAGGEEDQSELTEPPAVGYFIKDEETAEEKAEDEMAKRRNAFLLKQQRKAEEVRLRKQHQEVESEVKRDEARSVSVSHSG
ncbi:Calmodulin-regulated spectrin-associated protein 1 [Liparis tanakae]|uniref:Calmodulin-regulated spectrin-associated protein 1 n=1 Tax=Liparis tanakae TaxID=230148 RepID=A0A4Z2GPD1_9TELE|nr:Calmodulin-regulated spectrin-associated protein 1 [Liparis tanakae]